MKKTASKLIEWHKQFIITHGSTLEDTLRLLCYMIPANDDNLSLELRAQAIFSFCDLLAIYNEHLSSQTHPLILKLSPARRTIYETAQFGLKAIRCVQLLIEIEYRRRYGARKAFEMCVKIEIAKFILKQIALHTGPFQIHCEDDVLHSAHPVVEPQKKTESVNDEPLLPVWVGKRRKRRLRPLKSAVLAANNTTPSTEPETPLSGNTSEAEQGESESQRNNNDHSSKKNNDNNNNDNSGEGVREKIVHVYSRLSAAYIAWKLRRQGVTMKVSLAELAYQIRPIVHAALKVFMGGRSWTVWAAALGMEVGSSVILGGTSVVDDVVEKSELGQRRSRLLPGALLRSPVFELTLGGPLKWLESVIKRVPVLNWFLLIDVFLALRPYHFATSES